ncbi:UbiD family decarboxylase [Geotalea uraniireducens]|uniref:UbiD family decarboxylase n=1 Tax=Geotalea uraniireducens (strain Rf4) TaxID=351605 RepID=A5G4I0_GEOUR|nr:UbiD family decarboxylase [Geotalea uraniireducens]ABQ26698.1 UbiD family decarboxylase [Geotalea uraniireducens Rf4]
MRKPHGVELNDLRDWICLLKREEDLVEIDVPVDEVHAIGPITRSGFKRNLPALHFLNLLHSEASLLVNAFATRRRLALLLGTEESQLVQEYIKRTDRNRWCPPKVAEKAPCKEKKQFHEAVDIRRFPQTVWNPCDGGPYFTMGVVRVRNPGNGAANVSVNRLQVKDRNHLTIFTNKERGLGRAIWNYWEKGEPAPVVVTFGGDPFYLLAAIDTPGVDDDEMALAGGIKGQPLEVAYGEICRELDFPAGAEVVFEGVVHPESYEDEGPFGEVNGYLSEQGIAPVMEIQAVTHRDEPVFSGTYAGIPPVETTVIQDLMIEATLTKTLLKSGVDVAQIHIVPGSGGHQAAISIRKRNENDLRRVIRFSMAVLPIKQVLVTDADVDVSIPEQRQWVLSTRFDPAKDIHLIPHAPAINIDPMAQELDGKKTVTKMALDATRPEWAKGNPFIVAKSLVEQAEEFLNKYVPFAPRD